MQYVAEETLLNSLSPQDKKIDDFIKSQMPNACLIQSIGSELTYSISNKPEFTRTYHKFFTSLETSAEKLGIESIGLSDSTLEEIFIKLAKQPEDNSLSGNDKKLFGFINLTQIWEKIITCACCCVNRNKKYKASQLSDEQVKRYSEYTKLRVSNKFLLVNQQLYALLIKRFHRVKRNIKGFFAEIVLPVVFVCLAMLVATLNPATTAEPPLEIHPWYYQSPNQMFIAKTSSYNYDRPQYDKSPLELNLNPSVQSNIDRVNKVFNTFVKAPGPGNRCLSNHKVVVTRQAQEFSRAGGDRILSCNGYDSLLTNYTMPPQSLISALLAANYSYKKTGTPCDCSNGFPNNPAGAEGDIYYRQVYTLKTDDILYDLSGRNISDWIVNTEFTERIFRKRFGGYEFMQPFVNVSDQLLHNLVTQVQMFAGTMQSLLNKVTPNANVSGLQNTAADLVNHVFFFFIK